ncbi:hypothetical protein B0A49_07833 [Cryomyces minteri]|uniref:Uncharacterized protein n=1 Tax=Cryomyces minteri TaxID=331657 RepID=A0A4U0WTU5_9PEZI|nr:hypothetical protein B0A49_07833 [Cryomyces minteri]
MPRVFLITGTSTGFGAELVKTVLSSGDSVVATARDSSKLSFAGTKPSNYLAVDLDVTDQSSVSAAFDKALQHFARVDVVVNNAGYGLTGEFESLSEAQIRTQFEVNFFGLLNVTRKAMAVMRAQQPPGGLIQQVTSVGGQIGVPTFSCYCATKWAVEGFTEAVAQEVKPEWKIRFTVIEPGGFRTDFSGRSMAVAEAKNAAYDHIDVRANMRKRHGTQPGDPAKAAQKMYELAVMPDPPLRCLLGSDGLEALRGKLETYRENLDTFETLTRSTDIKE